MKISYILIPLYILGIGVFAWGSFTFGESFQQQTTNIVLFLLGGFVVINFFQLEKLQFLSKEFSSSYEKAAKKDTKEERQPLLEKPLDLAGFIISGLNAGLDINTITARLVSQGQNPDFIRYVIDNLIKQGILKPITPPAPAIIEPFSPNIQEEVQEIMQPKRKGAIKCPACKKPFKDEKQLRRHYGMAHQDRLVLQ